MDDLTILHLSDLHIDSEGTKYSKLLASLLSDIKKSKEESFADKNVVVVVTGDIIHMGNKSAISNAKRFFEDLKETLLEKIVGVYIVPGNHDKYRTEANKFLIPSYRSIMDNKISYNNKNISIGDKVEFNLPFAENFWRYQEESYKRSGYFDFVNFIYTDLFSEMEETKQIVTKTYGVQVLEVKGKKYCFVLLNTAWSCIDDKDIRHVILGDFQLNYIYEKFHELTDETDIELTFVLGHHPLEYFYGREQDNLFDKMISFNEMSANAYICGHTHDRNVINWSNNRHTIYTLMTGIGWKEVSGNHVKSHYYSIYSFNLDLNVMEILVKNSDDNGNFQADLRIYTGGDDAKEKLIKPIKFNDKIGKILFSTGIGISSKAMYASNQFLKYSSRVMQQLVKISVEARNWLEEDKEDFLNTYNFNERSQNEIDRLDQLLFEHMIESNKITFDKSTKNKEVEDILRENADFIYDKFQGFLQKLCDKLEQKFTADLQEGQVVRIHCRYLDRGNRCTYRGLCTSFSHNIDKTQYSLSDIEYGDLIEAIMEKERNQSGCMIYSLNEQLCKKKLKDKWRDFITIIPQIQENVYRKRMGNGNYKMAPFLTFGVTINNKAQEELLYCMDYLSAHVIIGDILQNYINTFLIDINKFCTWVKKDTNREARLNNEDNKKSEQRKL